MKESPNLICCGHIMSKKDGGFVMIDIALFWKARRMSWFRRLTKSKSKLVRLQRAEVYPCAFNPKMSNYLRLNKAKSTCKNMFWKELYASLLVCRENILKMHQVEFITLPINGELLITNKW